MSRLTLDEVQLRVWSNKVAKGFNTTDIALEFGLLTAEVGEAFTAWRKGDRHGLADELADIALFLAGLAEMANIDLEVAVERKLAVNAGRTYVRGPNGTLIKDGEEKT